MDVEALLRRFLGDSEAHKLKIHVNEQNRIILTVGDALEFVVVESRIHPWTPQPANTPAKPPPQVVGAAGFDEFRSIGDPPPWTPTSFSTSFGGFSSSPTTPRPLRFG